MIPELGQFALVLSLLLAMLGIILPLQGIAQKKSTLMKTAKPLLLGQCFFIVIAFFILVYSFIENDFSVSYVAIHSNSTLPLLYRICATWAGHEGSFLLWLLFLTGWGVLLSQSLRQAPLLYATRVLVVLTVFTAAFLIFLIFTSNPFNRLLPEFPLDGNDLNPLLQDPGLVVHPPLLYLGYVGLVIPFAFAVATLWQKDYTLPWAKWLRPWVLAAFAFLTLGITLGSYWAYYELGWGGWWFWDPVENASFIPWLLSIALLHSLMATDKQKLFPAWSLLLCLVIFATSLIGAFLIRSGVLASVHAFGSDPERGVYLLSFIVVFIGSAFVLYACRARHFISARSINALSRETLILSASLLLFATAMTILLGTVFPLFYEVMTGHKISVGFPYFNTIFVPMITPILVLIPLGPLLRWGAQPAREIARKIKGFLLLSVLLCSGIGFYYSTSFTVQVGLSLSLAFWISLGTLKFISDKWRNKHSISMGALGMFAAHFGVAISFIGVVLVSYYEVEKDVSLAPGQSIRLAHNKITFEGLETTEGSNYVGYQGHFIVKHDQNPQVDLYPEKRIFVVQKTKMTETAIEGGFFRDIYIALGERLSNGQWSVRLYYKPFVRWIWAGALLMACGGFCGAFARRMKKR